MFLRLAKTTRRTVASLFTGLAIAILLYWLSQGEGLMPGYLSQLEHIFYDLTFKLYTLDAQEADSSQTSQNQRWEDRIQIVDIDERSLDRLGAYNLWPRTHHAQVLKALGEGGASAIAFDILFKNADFGATKTREVLEAARRVRPEIAWEKDSAALRSLLNHDSVLVDAVKKNGNSIVCALMASRQIYVHETQWRPLSEPAWQQRIGTRYTLGASQVPDSSSGSMDLLDNVFPELAQAGPLGLVNVVPDEDGVHRSVPLLHGFPNPELYPDAKTRYYPVLALQTALHLYGFSPSQIKVEPGRYLELGKPLGIYRDSSGLLRTTYPNLSWPMLSSLRAQGKDLEAMAKDSSLSRMAEIASRVIVRRDSLGVLGVEISGAQTLNGRMLDALLHASSTWESLQKAQTQPQALASGIEARWSESEGLPLLYDTESEEETTLDSFTLSTLRYFAKEIPGLKAGSTLYLSCDLDLAYQWARKRWKSNFIILGDAVLRDLWALDSKSLDALKPGDPPLRLGDVVRIPIDARNRMQILYQGRYAVPASQSTFKQISYYDLLAGRIDLGAFQGKVFVLGSTAPALFDLVSAPHESVYPGVLIHATLLQNILAGDFLTLLDERAQLLLCLGLALLCALLGSFLRPLYALPALGALLAAYYAVAYGFFENGLYLGMARQMLTMLLGFFAMMVLRYLFEEREKHFLKDAFRQYISPDLIEEMVRHEIKPTLGGTQSDLTAFFTDIAGFSTFSEQIGDPSRLVELLNEYLSAMTDLLVANQGTLDKYEGDAIIAFFGAPMPLPNHRQNACVAALLMQKKLQELRLRWQSQGDKWPTIVHAMHMRIGINSGAIVTGNMGSAMRKNYTMMGDAVNLAARLESAAKQYGAYIQVSRNTLEGLEKDSILYRSLDKMRVVGKSEPVETFELLALAADATPELLGLVKLWEEARGLYLDQQWEAAEALFARCEELEPFHPTRDPGSHTCPSLVYQARCARYRLAPPVPPGTPWDGVYTALEK